MKQRSLFEQEQRKKEKGMGLAAAKNGDLVRSFQEIAQDLWDLRGAPVSIEEVRQEAQVQGVRYTPGNWMGSVFKGGPWLHYGFKAAGHKGSHGRMVRLWVQVTK